jgi:hypothetical protein
MQSEQEIIEILFRNRNIKTIVSGNPFPKDLAWYLAGGCIHQTIWNHLTGREPGYGIADYDLVYYDPTDLSEESELHNQKRIDDLFGNLGVEIEVVNEARVHLWKKDSSGKNIKPYSSCEDAISTWLTTVTTNGITSNAGAIKLYSTFGFDDVFNMSVHPNKEFADKHYYQQKINRWRKVWPKIIAEDWL